MIDMIVTHRGDLEISVSKNIKLPNGEETISNWMIVIHKSNGPVFIEGEKITINV